MVAGRDCAQIWCRILKGFEETPEDATKETSSYELN
jgi:hypothetical protein